jgi:hypothetical protein
MAGPSQAKPGQEDIQFAILICSLTGAVMLGVGKPFRCTHLAQMAGKLTGSRPRRLYRDRRDDNQHAPFRG